MTRILNFFTALTIRLFVSLPLFLIALTGKVAETVLDSTNKQVTIKLKPNHEQVPRES